VPPFAGLAASIEESLFMSRSAERSCVDWRCVALLAWMALVGAFYTAMVIEAKTNLRLPPVTQAKPQ
jgi:uncharacterized membrane protein YfcA